MSKEYFNLIYDQNKYTINISYM